MAKSGYERRLSKREGLEFFPTPPAAVRAFIPHLTDFGWMPEDKVLEPSVGLGSMSDTLMEHFHHVECWDVKDYGYEHLMGLQDFLEAPDDFTDAELCVQNPPWRLATEFVLKALSLPSIKATSVLVRSNFIEGHARYEKLFSKHPPRWIVQFSGRVPFRANRTVAFEHGLHAMAWWHFEKGYQGAPSVRWITEPMKHWRKQDDERYVYVPPGAVDTPAMLAYDAD